MATEVDVFDQVYRQDNPPGEAHGWIQWKGTDVCADVYCRCGAQDHVDRSFFYHYECPECGQRYAVGGVIKLIPISQEEADELF